MSREKELTDTSQDEKPPIFRSWAQMYAFVLILHCLIIFLFYLLTQAYS